MWHSFESAFALCDKEQLGDLYYNVGYIFACSGEMDYAKRCFKMSLTSEPNNPDSLAGLGQIAYFEGDRQKTVALLTASMTITGKDATSLDVLYNLAVCYEELGDFDNAYKHAIMVNCHAKAAEVVDKEVKNLVTRLENIVHLG